jgi:hypothetical protein
MEFRFTRYRALCATALCTVALLAGCGGNGNNASPSTPNSPPSNPPAPPVPPASGSTSPVVATPLPSQKSFVGAVSFGDTIRVDLDTPSTGLVTLTFLDSQFGLAGSLVGSYTPGSTSSFGTQYSVGTLSASSSAVPEALASQAFSIQMDFSLSPDSNNRTVLSGSLTGVTNVKGGGVKLSGQIQATNNGTTTVDSLAGTYSFIKTASDYTAAGVAQGTQDVETGQIKINTDGTVRFCNGGAYSDACVVFNPATNTSAAMTGTITVDPDQVTYPGAFDVSANGVPLGRMFVSSSGTQTSLFLDEADSNSDGTYRTGSWVMTTTQTLVGPTSPEAWFCTEPAVDSTTNALTGNLNLLNRQFSSTEITPLTSGGFTFGAAPTPISYNETFDPAASQTNLTLISGVDGLIAGEAPTALNGQAGPAAQVYMPVGSNQMIYLDEPNANGFFVTGSCIHVPAASPPP